MNGMLRRTSSALLVVLCVVGSVCAVRAAEAPPSDSLQRFHEANFGVAFSHPKSLTTSYNPHGAADRVGINHEDESIGGLMIRPAPDKVPLEEFIEEGRDYFRRKFGATEVAYSVIETPGGYRFHHLRAQVTIEGVRYVVERYVHLRGGAAKTATGPQAPEAIARAVVDSLAGAFSFEFMCSATTHQKIDPAIRVVIDTFRLK